MCCNIELHTSKDIHCGKSKGKKVIVKVKGEYKKQYSRKKLHTFLWTYRDWDKKKYKLKIQEEEKKNNCEFKFI